jgi:O-antigen/teichoic acid export membrane protein
MRSSQSEPPLESNSATKANSLKRRLFKSTMVVTAGRLLGIGAMIFGNFLLARLLTPPEFGVYLLVTNIVVVGSIIACQGLNRSLVRFIAESLAHENTQNIRHVLSTALWLAIPGVSLVSLAVWLGWPLFEPAAAAEIKDSHLPIAIAFLLALLTLHQLLSETLRGFHAEKYATMLSGQSGGPLATILFLLMVIVWSTWSRTTLDVVLNFNVLALSLIAIPALFWLRRTYKHACGDRNPNSSNVELTPARYIVRTSLVLMAVQLVAFIASQGDVWIAARSPLPDELALYGAARRAANLVSFPLQLASLSVLPLIPSLYATRRTAELQSVLSSSALYSGLPSMLACGALIVVPGAVLGLCFGDFYKHGGSLLAILAVGQLVFVSCGTAPLVLMMTGHEVKVTAISGVAAVALLVGGELARQSWGMVGLAIVQSTITALQHLVCYFVCLKCCGLRTEPPIASIFQRRDAVRACEKPEEL